MTGLFTPVLSDAEVLERVRVKVRCGGYFFGPQVGVSIEGLKRAKRRGASGNPDNVYPTVCDNDLLDVILAGTCTECSPLTTEPKWAIVINGVDNDGSRWNVNVYLNYDENEPLDIWSFVPCEMGED